MGFDSKLHNFKEHENMFPFFWVKDSLEIETEDIKENLYLIRKEVKYGREFSNHGGYQTLDNLHEISIFVDKFLNPFISFMEATVDITPKIHTMWGNINGKNAFNTFHTHTKHMNLDKEEFSAVFYLKVPKNSGKIGFFHPLSVDHQYWIQPLEKDLIIFPAYVPHMVEPNNSDEERISLALNFKI